MSTFSFRAVVDRDPKWGPRGRRSWTSDCGCYRIEQRFEAWGVAIRPRERYLALRLFGPKVLGRSLTRKAAIARCTADERRAPTRYRAKQA